MELIPVTSDHNLNDVSQSIQFGKDQWDTLHAIMDTCTGTLNEQDTQRLVDQYSKNTSAATITALAKLKATDLNTQAIVHSFLNRSVPPSKQKQLKLVLSLLSTRTGMFFLTGHFALMGELSIKDREGILNGWRLSSIPRLRFLYRSITNLCLYPVSHSPDNRLLHQAMGYSYQDAVRMQSDYQPVNSFLRLPMLTETELLSYSSWDCIVIGSGAGGGVTAAQLAKAGKSVLVIEKGTYYHESEFSLTQHDGFVNLYENHGPFPTNDGGVNILAGSTFGGGTTVNWSTCLQLQHFVREEWANQGLSHFVSPKFTKDLDYVFQRIGASISGIKHNGSNQVLVDGCRALGCHVADAHQNTGGQPHSCSFCYAGCKDGIKRGTTNTWLRDAQESGARFMDRTKVLRVLTKNGVAVGVEAVINHASGQSRVKIYSNIVVCAGGSLQTPGVLQRSGLRNKHIGRNLRLHSCIIVHGFFSHTIDAFKGSIMTSVSNVAENQDGEGYGCKLEVSLSTASGYSAYLPWRGTAHYKETMLRYRHSSPVLILNRDKDSKGMLQYDDQGNLSIDYQLSAHDRQSMLCGLLRSADILVAAGAREIQSPQYAAEPFIFDPQEESRVDNPRYIDWKGAVAKIGIPIYGAGIVAAHEMGTARMGVSPNVSATKPNGETWEIKKLFVADASLFPTSTGVNPMVTVEALALHISECILKNDGASAKL